MPAVSRKNNAFLYQQVIDMISGMVESGTLKPGDKLPSLRKLSVQLNVSLPVVKQAYIELVDQGRVVARPQSGFYIQPGACPQLKPYQPGPKKFEAVRIDCSGLIGQICDMDHHPDTVHLGISYPCRIKPATKTLNRAMRRAISRMGETSLDRALTNGSLELRRQLAIRFMDQGLPVDPEEIIITNGAQEAMSLALQAVAQPGDVIAVESPGYFGMLELIEGLGMRAVEIDTCPDDGIQLDCLQSALDQFPVKACLFSTAINNPLGSIMPPQEQEKLVAMLEARDIPLIEDDVYSELHYEGARPRLARRHATKRQVLSISSFSKTAAPGYRIGWLLPGQYHARASLLKRAQSGSTPILLQQALTEFIRYGEFDTHLKAVRSALVCNRDRMKGLIAKYFPPETRVSKPRGGGVLWLELPENIDMVDLFHRAMAQGVGFSPGKLFSPGGRYHNYIRLSYGVPWNDQLIAAVIGLGRLVADMSGSPAVHP